MLYFKNLKNYRVVNFVTTAVFSGLLVASLIFIFFRKLDQKEDEKIISNIKTILRNEVNLRNTYALSKSLVDLETIGVIRCSSLKEENNSFVYYDTISIDNCSKSLFLSLRKIRAELKAQSGFTYEFYFVKNLNYFSLIVEFSSYLILICLVYLFKNFVQITESRITTRQKIFEIEKKLMQDHAKQISHDVASPLSAIKMVVELVKNIDPEIKEILLNSIQRTQSIFDDLKNEKGTQSASVNVIHCLSEIVSEKKAIWGENCSFNLELSKEDLVNVVANEQNLKRIFSNILNNSYESMNHLPNKNISIYAKYLSGYIEISILDSGIGLPEDILPNIGKKGFSYGKQEISTAGSGLGLYSSIQLLKSWGGDLTLSSKLNEGTSVTIKLKIYEF